MKMDDKKNAAGGAKVCGAVVKTRNAKWFLNVFRETVKAEVPLESVVGRSPRNIARPHNEVESQLARRQHAHVRASADLPAPRNRVLRGMADFDRSCQQFDKCVECDGMEAKRSAH